MNADFWNLNRPEKCGMHIAEGAEVKVLSGSKLRQIVDSKVFLDFCHFVDVHVDSISAERLPFDLLELLTEGVIFMRRDNLVQLRKQHSVFARLMRRVHPHKSAQIVGKPASLFGSLQGLCRAKYSLRQASSRLMLLIEHIN